MSSIVSQINLIRIITPYFIINLIRLCNEDAVCLL
jgi:hypothetical protein